METLVTKFSRVKLYKQVQTCISTFNIHLTMHFCQALKLVKWIVGFKYRYMISWKWFTLLDLALWLYTNLLFSFFVSFFMNAYEIRKVICMHFHPDRLDIWICFNAMIMMISLKKYKLIKYNIQPVTYLIYTEFMLNVFN